jgi:nucleoside-diphosphate-sugar epimerase
MVKVLITGGAGYIGTSLIPQVLNEGYQVTVFDNLIHGGNQLLPFFNHPNFEFIKGDIRDVNQLKDVVKGKDIIIHLLATDVNVQGTINLINVCDKNQIIFYGSTGSNYGAVTEICTELTPLNPLSLYGETKTEAEQLLLERDNTIAYRFATAFGVSPRLRLDLLVNDFANKCIRDGYLVVYEKKFMRTFIHVDDIARCFIFGMNNMSKMINNVYNVGNDSMNYSKEEVCNMIASRTNAFIHYEEIGEDADKRNYIVSYDKIKSLGFETKTTMDEGIDQVIKTLKVIDFGNTYTNARYL